MSSRYTRGTLEFRRRGGYARARRRFVDDYLDVNTIVVGIRVRFVRENKWNGGGRPKKIRGDRHKCDLRAPEMI